MTTTALLLLLVVLLFVLSVNRTIDGLRKTVHECAVRISVLEHKLDELTKPIPEPEPDIADLEAELAAERSGRLYMEGMLNVLNYDPDTVGRNRNG